MHPLLAPYDEAFHALNKRRQFSMAELPLLGQEILIHAKVHYFADDIEFFYRAMTEMDEEYMQYILKIRKEESKGKDKPNIKA